MSNGSSKRPRTERVASFRLPPGRFSQTLAQLRQGRVLLRIALGLAAAVALWAVMRPWNPPFLFRVGAVPKRDVISRASFDVPDPEETKLARRRAERQTRHVYTQDPEPLIQLRSLLANRVGEILDAATLDDLADVNVWREFRPVGEEGADGGMPPTREAEEEQFEQFRAALAGDKRQKFVDALADVFALFERRGLLDKLQHEEGDQKEIFVHLVGHPEKKEVVQVADVLIGVQTADNSPFQQRLKEHPDIAPIADEVFTWLRHRLKETLSHNDAATEEAAQAAREAVPDVMRNFPRGAMLAAADVPLTPTEVDLLKREQEAVLADPELGSGRWSRALAMFLVVLVVVGICAGHALYRGRELLANVSHLLIVVVLAVTMAGLARWLTSQAWRLEIVPLLLVGTTVAIVYRREMAIVISLALACLVVLFTGQDVGTLLVLVGVCATAVLQLTRIRSRIKLIRVCAVAALVAFLLTMSLGVVGGATAPRLLLQDALSLAACTVATGFLITGLLPFIERVFGVLTDLSLLELGDASHPLLQELVRRAPGTYNHSINVASIGEAAAEAIGARGLLVRVGAYFHDIGKMLKPRYFVENQGTENDQHESLVPAMSTLIIIAHVKDGADLARKHHLPQAIIDFIEQHHGTTLVEYFYRRANEQQQENPDSGAVEERSFRYPGPRPQSREAAVLMLADAAESVCRTLVEPTPARIENVVETIATTRLMDGQFDECRINLKEIRAVQDSLTKTLIAVYHGRIKYPSQRTA